MGRICGVYTPKECPEEPETRYYLRLRDTSTKSKSRFYIEVVDEKGRLVSKLLEIDEYGLIYRFRSVNPDIGFPLDSQGRLEEVD
jgi:hypothetical protein